MNLETAYWILGGILAIFGATILVSGPKISPILSRLPRSKSAAVLLWGGALCWFFYHVATLREVDLAGFPRWLVALFFGGAGIAAFKFLNDLLPLRALGVLALFSANELLKAGFAQTPYSLVLASTSYLLIIAGMWVGVSPYVLRDFIFNICEREKFARISGAIFLLVGAANLGNALFFLPPNS